MVNKKHTVEGGQLQEIVGKKYVKAIDVKMGRLKSLENSSFSSLNW